MEIPVHITSENNAWIIGSVGQYLFEAKVFEEPSDNCYRKGHVQKFEFMDSQRKRIAYYDSGQWAEGRLSKDERPFFLAAVKAATKYRLETANH